MEIYNLADENIGKNFAFFISFVFYFLFSDFKLVRVTSGKLRKPL